MRSPQAPAPATDRNSDLAATVVRERSRLGNFIRRRIRNPEEAEDLLQAGADFAAAATGIVGTGVGGRP